MPWQLIYTSAPRTLVAGQSGYGTVARSVDLRESLAQRLEQLSYYSHPHAIRPEPLEPQPIVFAYRILDFRGSRYHVLTRVQDAGLDFTNRTNHLAHHLVFEPSELAGLPPPAIILAEWSGWQKHWQEQPTLLRENDWGNLYTLPRCMSLPAVAWQHATGDAGSAAALLDRAYAAGCTLTYPAELAPILLNLFAESLQLLDTTGRQAVKLWEYTFTTLLQAQDNPSDFRWRAYPEGTDHRLTGRRSTDPASLAVTDLAAPANSLAKLARDGPSKPASAGKSGPRPLMPGPPGSMSSLRLETPQSVPRPLRGYDPAQFESPPNRRAAKLPRQISLDFSSPRVWIPSLVLIIGALFFFLEVRRHGGLRFGSATARTPAHLSNNPVLVQKEGIHTPQESTLADESSSVEPSPRKAPLPQPTKEALAQLASQMDQVPTWLVPLDSEFSAPLPVIKELDQLLRQVFLADRPLSVAAIDCSLTARRLDFSSGSGLKVDVREEYGPKGLGANLPVGHGFQLDCNSWLADKGVGRSVLFVGRNLRDAGVLTLFLKPGSELATFSPFRLVAVANSQFEPIRLSKTLLVAGTHDFQNSFRPELSKWLHSIQVADANAKWQLRPSTRDSAKLDLIDNLAEAFRPGPDRPLDFDLIRERIHVPLAVDQEKLANLTKAIDELQSSMQNDRPLGEILTRQTNELASLATFSKARNRKMDRPTYLLYLKELLTGQDQRLASRLPSPDATQDDIRMALVSLPGFIEQNPHLGPRLRHLPAGYFESRWDILGRAPELVRKASESESTRRSIARYEGFLKLIPADLANTPRVSLILSPANGKRYELVRFEDPPVLSASPAP